MRGERRYDQMTVESVQIQTLQRIIQVQDEMLNTDDIDVANVWRNECYRLNAVNGLLVNELRAQSGRQREAMQQGIRVHAETVANEFERCVKEKLAVFDKQMLRAERAVRTLRNQTPGNELLRLVEEKRRMAQQMHALQSELDDKDQELASQKSSQVHGIAREVQTDPEPRMSLPKVFERKDNDVRSLLAELKSIESEAKLLLIKQ